MYVAFVSITVCLGLHTFTKHSGLQKGKQNNLRRQIKQKQPEFRAPQSVTTLECRTSCSSGRITIFLLIALCLRSPLLCANRNKIEPYFILLCKVNSTEDKTNKTKQSKKKGKKSRNNIFIYLFAWDHPYRVLTVTKLNLLYLTLQS